MITLNKGEWSEVYTVLKLLSDGRLYAADEGLNMIPNIYYPLIGIIRKELNGHKVVSLEYGYSSENMVRIVDKDQGHLSEVCLDELKDKTIALLNDIKAGDGRAFSVSKLVGNFLESIYINKMSASSDTKRDITIVVHDIFTGFEPELGFSIKSQLGKAATLLNASGATNFIYKISGEEFSTDELLEVNSAGGVTEIIKHIRSTRRELQFNGMQNQIFYSNLQMIDSSFPEIVASMLLSFYAGECGASLSNLLSHLTKANPCGYDDNQGHPFYEYKLKTFLVDVALGLMPSEVWTGRYDANGGYIVVKNDGELVCYHTYNRNEFQDYLLKNTKLERGDRKKHGYGKVYNENGSSFLKLNFQIRFKK